jgi:hypothetical protein
MKPIIFSTPMVQAILEGRKTQTRRVIKVDDAPENWKISIAGTSIVRTEPYDVKLPRYAAGDVLWVREAWCKNENPNSPNYGGYEYYADYEGAHCQSLIKWRSPIFMPREAARLFLKVKTVRVERLHDITENDARNEGVKDPYDYQEPSYYNQPHVRGMEINKSAFAGLWDSLNAKRGYGWDTNPLVWVYEFEKFNKE